MSEISIDRDAFFRRVKTFYRNWKKSSAECQNLNKADSLVVCVGQESDIVYSKSQALQTWLFGYEMTDVIMVFTRKAINILSSKKKIEFLKKLESSKENQEDVPPVSLFVREKSDKDAENFKKLISTISQGGKTVGEFIKDRKVAGDFANDWRKEFNEQNYELIDVSTAFAYILAVKDEAEISLITKASSLSCELFSKYLREEITEIIDSDKKVRHNKLADNVEAASQNKKYMKNVDVKQVELCYTPIIQSGGNYNLKFSAISDKNILHFGAITCSLGIRYNHYCSNVVRTLLVNPTEEQKKLYEFLVSLQEKVIDKLRDGIKLSDLYDFAVNEAGKFDKKLVDKFTKNCGFAMGIEFREGSLLVAPKSSSIAKKGMIFNISMGFSDLVNKEATDSEGKTYALFIGDTVLVADSSNGGIVLTQSKKKLKSIAIIIKDENDSEEDDEKEAEEPEVLEEIYGRGKRGAIVESKLRMEQTAEDKRKKHQDELAKTLNEAARARLANKGKDQQVEKSRKSNISYKNVSQLPNEKEIAELKIYVDKKYESVFLPILGISVPFHISTIKNISSSIEGDYTYLRINFFYPGTTTSKTEQSMFANTLDFSFLKELTYRSTNLKEAGEISAPSANLNTAFRLIKEVQKKFRNREAEEREKEGIVKQDTLILSQVKSNPKLKDLYIRPNIMTKRIHGTLEAHQNGFRFTSIRGDKIDIMYNNIKHAFFQPCDGEMLILLHFHLKNPIMFGKKKQSDVQFYTEVGEITTDLGKHQHMHDRDDLAAEQAEREMRSKLKSAFKAFYEKVETMTRHEVEFDTPFRDLGFYAVPNRSNVLLQPTSVCLVNLTDWPPFVITLEDLELVHFERVSFHIKNFDMVFIFKDYSRKVLMATLIPINMLDHVKNWLNSCDIRYTEGVQSLNWVKIMKTITDDPEGFFDNGGWSFLDSNGSDEEQDDEDEEEDEYDPDSGEEASEDESESDYSEDSEASEVDDSEDAMGSSEESGKDWSELEEEAAKADKERGEYEHEDDRNTKKVLSKKSERDRKSLKRHNDDKYGKNKKIRKN